MSDEAKCPCGEHTICVCEFDHKDKCIASMIFVDQTGYQHISREDFKEFVSELKDELRKGDMVLTRFISTLVMQTYAPSFVIVASPFMEKLGNGQVIPNEISISMDPNTITNSDMAAVLEGLLKAFQVSIENEMNKLLETEKSTDE